MNPPADPTHCGPSHHLSACPALPARCRLAALAVGMVFPVLESFRAIESKGEDDDKQWCAVVKAGGWVPLPPSFRFPVVISAALPLPPG